MTTFLRQCTLSAAAVAMVLTAGCSQSTNKASVSGQSQAPAQTEGAAQVVAAKTAFWPMYTAAHQWSSDVVAISVTAKEVPGFTNEGGKAGMWEAVFASASKGKYRTYTYSITSVPPNIYKGVVAGVDMPWSGFTRDAMAVDTAQFNIDSDAAYQAAATAAADWIRKNPAKPLTTIAMADTYKFQEPVWYVMWGTKQAGYAAIVDANSGKVLKR